jgi:O-antigen/teichoic acid export membrane protein
MLLVPTLLLAAIVWIYGEAIIGLAFGGDYRAAWPALAILTGATVVWCLSGISVALLHAARHEALVSYAFGMSLAVSGVGIVFASADGRAEVIALVVLIGTAVRSAFLVVQTWRLVGIDPTIAQSFRLLKNHRQRDR